VVSAAVLTATLLPALRATGGHVVLVNSAPGLRGVPGWSGYLGSKSVLRVLADSLRVEEPALRVATVYPGGRGHRPAAGGAPCAGPGVRPGPGRRCAQPGSLTSATTSFA